VPGRPGGVRPPAIRIRTRCRSDANVPIRGGPRPGSRRMTRGQIRGRPGLAGRQMTRGVISDSGSPAGMTRAGQDVIHGTAHGLIRGRTAPIRGATHGRVRGHGRVAGRCHPTSAVTRGRATVLGPGPTRGACRRIRTMTGGLAHRLTPAPVREVSRAIHAGIPVPGRGRCRRPSLAVPLATRGAEGTTPGRCRAIPGPCRGWTRAPCRGWTRAPCRGRDRHRDRNRTPGQRPG
jgi:hypothetical protein